MKTDDEINACRRDPVSPCRQTCPDRARCAELMRQEWQAALGTDPPEKIEYIVISGGHCLDPLRVEYETGGKR